MFHPPHPLLKLLGLCGTVRLLRLAVALSVALSVALTVALTGALSVSLSEAREPPTGGQGAGAGGVKPAEQKAGDEEGVGEPKGDGGAEEGPTDEAAGPDREVSATTTHPGAVVVLSVQSLAHSASFPLAAGSTCEVVQHPDGPRLRFGERQYALDEILFLRFTHIASTPEPAGARPAEGPSPVVLELQGGDRLLGTVASGDEERIRLRSASWGGKDLDVSVDHLVSLIVPDAFSSAATLADFRRKVLAKRPPVDRLHLAAGDRIDGILEAAEPKGVRFTKENLGELLYPYEKVMAVQLADLGDEPAPEEANGMVTVLHLADGSVLSGALEGISTEVFRLAHATLGAIDIPVRSLLQVSVRGGRCQFLSDLEVKRAHEHLGILTTGGEGERTQGLRLPHVRDLSVLGTPLRMGRQTFAKGLGVHAYSLLEYDLGGEFQRFQATVGLDDSARPLPGSGKSFSPSVVFRIYVDGKKLREVPLSYKDAPRSVDVDVTSGETLGIEVDFGSSSFLPVRARANWADARIIKNIIKNK